MFLCPVCNSSNAPGSATCRACGAPLGAGSTPGATLPGGAPVSAAALAPGTTLNNGNFRVDSVLGQGGFGITYRGHDNGLQREVAIKEFFPYDGALRIAQDNRLEPTGGLSRAEFERMRDRFLEEARTLARFNHRGIVNVYTVFAEKNTAYMVMEFLRGQSLMQMVEKSGPLPENQAIDFIEKAAGALEEVHKVGLLHRDLKPDNIQVCDGRVVLLDFGSAFDSKSSAQAEAQATPGYAPLEQYSTTSKFGAYTDIYALAATLYCLLTGAPPPAAPDRANGVALVPPVQSGKVSRSVSDAIVWALEINVAKRPQTVQEWLLKLRGANTNSSASSPAWSTPGASTPVAPAAPNPSEPRIRQLLGDLNTPAPLPASSYDARIIEVQNQLARAANFPVPPADTCPNCNARTLCHVAPAVGASQCPLCDGPLIHRQLNPARCAVCRGEPLQEYSFDAKQIFCPLCRVAPLREDKRKKFGGLAVDLWLNCPNCKAEWDEFSGGNAKLNKADDAISLGGETRRRAEEWLNQTKPLSEWKTLAARSEKVLRCGACAAQWDVLSDGRDKLVRWPRDPHGVGKQFGEKAFFRRAWTRIAHELPLNSGNCACQKCKTEWNWDAQMQTLQFVGGDDRYNNLKNKTQSVSAWRFEMAGKTSGRAGEICAHCKSEWDEENGAWKLVRAASGPLERATGGRHAPADWHRIARGLPDSTAEAALRQEAARLQNAKATEQKNWREAEARRMNGLEQELDELLRQSVLNGFLRAPIARSRSLKTGEEARWSGQAVLLRLRSRGGIAYWENDRSGVLLFSDSRVIFEESPGAISWERPLAKLRRAETPVISGTTLLELHFDGLKNPVGFIVSQAALDVVVENRSRRLIFTSVDLAKWLNSL